MSTRNALRSPVFVCAVFTFGAGPRVLAAQSAAGPRALIAGPIDETKLERLAGNTRPEANAQNDQGAVADDFAMDHMLLQLRRPAEQEVAAAAAIDAINNPQSPAYRNWMTAAQFGQLFGPAESDIDTVTSWLQSKGFTVHAAYPGRMTIDFSGTAGQIRLAFHTEIHKLNVNGASHVANMTDPQIPAALAPAVHGVASMHDFKAHAMRRSRRQLTDNYQGQKSWAVTPEDLATIYNLAPLFANGDTGAGQTIAVVEDARLYDNSDWDTFRSAFGLTHYPGGTLSVVQPTATAGGANCSTPGLGGGDDGEAALDAEWASAAAPSANIVVAACENTQATDGTVIALENLINSANPPFIISVSYGICEAENGAAANALFNAAFEQATAEGISVFVSAGDAGAAACDGGARGATHGIAVNAWASTPYNVAVGGTDFGDTYANTNSTYWNSTNDSNYGSAISYIPEIPWNDSCASRVLARAMGYSATFGNRGFCSSSAAQQDGLVQVQAGSGGPSGCATGAPDVEGIVGGSCRGYAKPSWQSGLAGIPNDGVRDIPDVSLFAGTAVWGHYYVTCWSDLHNGGAPCTGNPIFWTGGGGTSFAAPIMAGIQALINQKLNGPQGNPNYVYYQLAIGAATCNSSNGDPGAGPCIFHNVTEGDIDVDCAGAESCYGAAASGGGGRRGSEGGGFEQPNGALSASSDSYAPAFPAAPGWNFATGIGSVNAANLLNHWPKR